MNVIIEIGPNLTEVLWAVGAIPFCWFGAKFLFQLVAALWGMD